MKIEIDGSKIIVSLAGTIAVAAFVWMWSINARVAVLESPEAIASRVKGLEDLIFPIAVEYEIRKRSPLEGPDKIKIARPGERSKTPVEEETDIYSEAEDNVRSIIEQRPIEEARERRGQPIANSKAPTP